MATRSYLGIAEPGPDNWSISFPAFPGVVTTGETFPEIMTHARDALASAVEDMQQDGVVIPDAPETQPGHPGGEPDLDLSFYRDPRLVMVPVEVEPARSAKIIESA